MKNRKYKKEQRQPLFEESDMKKGKKKERSKQKYKHRNHWLMEDDTDYELPKYKDEEE